jgi:hypothetical protein
METAPYSTPEREDQWVDDEAPLSLPARKRRRFNGPVTAGLVALLVGAIGFYVGIRVEKGQMPSSTTGGGTGSRLAAALAGRGATGGAGGGAAAGGGGGFARAFAGGGGAGGGNASIGTISSVNGKTLFLTDVTGNTVKVTLSGATTITKSVGVSAKSVRPGDAVVITGLKGSNGTIAAASITDSGNRGGGGGGGSGSGSGAGSTSASSAVSSLFGSGSGG